MLDYCFYLCNFADAFAPENGSEKAKKTVINSYST